MSVASKMDPFLIKSYSAEIIPNLKKIFKLIID